jgi:voltage-gated potassium channel
VRPMTFVRQFTNAAVLVTLTLSLQCAGMAALIAWGRIRLAHGIFGLKPMRSALLMVRFTTAIIVLHLFEIVLWAGFYRWCCGQFWESAFYFSAASYATVGCSDVVLPQMWRIFGPLESVVGVLMCGFSASFVFAVLARLLHHENQPSREIARPA